MAHNFSFDSEECVVHKEVTFNISSLFHSPMSLPDEGTQTQDFEFSGAMWHIRIGPHPNEKENTLVYVVREIPSLPSAPLRLVDWTVGIRYATGGVFAMESGEEDLRDNAGTRKTLRPECIVTRRGFNHLRESLLPLGHITLFCILRVVNWTCAHTCTSPRTMGPSKVRLVSDLRNLLSSGEGYDVTFKVGGVEFKAHKAIVCARVPVFNVMFRHGMVESNSGVVKVDDCEPDTFATMLYFLYTGSIHSTRNTGDIFSLYAVADKYQVDTLKAECVDVMRSSLSVDTFCRCAILAIRHHEQQLLEHVIIYLSNNYKKIMPSDSWKVFLSRDPLQANNLLVKALLGVKEEPIESEVQIVFPSPQPKNDD